MDRSHRLGIFNPAEGLIVYQTDYDKGYYFFNGNTWSLFSEPPYISPWTVSGDSVFRILGPDTIMTVSEDYVGIGVTNPTVMLDVAEEIRAMLGVRFGYFGAYHDNLIWSNQYGLELDNFQTTDIRFHTSETPGMATLRMSIKPDGRIGIGTDSPGGLLGLQNSDTYIDLDVMDNLIFKDIHFGPVTLIDLLNGHWLAQGDTIHRIVGTDTVVTITDDNVGIGVTNPAVLLDVAEELRVGWGVKYGRVNGTVDNYIWSNQYGFEIDNFEASDIRFMTGETPGSANLRMSIKPDGNIGINNEFPDQKLAVEGGVRIGNGTDQDSRDVNMLYIGDAEFVRLGEWHADDKLSLHASSFSFELGDVGIGVVSPARKLHVNDVMRLEPRDTAPGSAQMGDMYVRSSDGKLMVYDGSVWRACW
jgi:hypothetical protein